MAIVADKYLIFYYSKLRGKKTYDVDVHASKDDIYLGTIKWNSGWRRYTFYPENKTLFDRDCLESIMNFIDDLMEERAQEREKKL